MILKLVCVIYLAVGATALKEFELMDKVARLFCPIGRMWIRLQSVVSRPF